VGEAQLVFSVKLTFTPPRRYHLVQGRPMGLGWDSISLQFTEMHLDIGEVCRKAEDSSLAQPLRRTKHPLLGIPLPMMSI
jgi:hypothetical protein